MLNPESVDYNDGRVRLLFTDGEGHEVLKVYLSDFGAWRLHEMIQDRCNMQARAKRTDKDEKYDPAF